MAIPRRSFPGIQCPSAPWAFISATRFSTRTCSSLAKIHEVCMRTDGIAHPPTLPACSQIILDVSHNLIDDLDAVQEFRRIQVRWPVCKESGVGGGD